MQNFKIQMLRWGRIASQGSKSQVLDNQDIKPLYQLSDLSVILNIQFLEDWEVIQ